MKKENTCSVCGAQLIQEKINYTQELAGKIYIVAEVPAEVCSQCGEQYLLPDTVDALQELIEKGEAKVKVPEKTIEVPVYNFS